MFSDGRLDVRAIAEWCGLLTVVSATVLATRVYQMTHIHAALISVVAVGAMSLLVGVLTDPGELVAASRRVWPVVALAVTSAVVYALTAVRIDAGAVGWLRVSLAPACWVAACLLGCLAARRGQWFPLLGAAVCSTTGAAAGVLDALSRSGAAGSLGQALISWNSSVGVWVPLAGQTLRSVGLEIDPNTYGLLGLVCLIPALTMEEYPLVRGWIASCASVVLVLSGSRTAIVAAALVTLIVALTLAADRTGRRRRGSALLPVAVGIALAIGVFAMGQSVLTGSDALHRIKTSATLLVSTPAAPTGAANLDEALGGRTIIWRRALSVYVTRPLGAFLPPESLIGRSVHNEYLDRLVYGGPLMLLVFLVFLVWLFRSVRPPLAPALGLAMCVAYAAAAVTLGPSLLPPFMVLAFYLIGWGANTRDRMETFEQAHPLTSLLQS